MATTLAIKTRTKIDTIELDCTVSESHNGEVEVTEHPVEEGANITDHTRAKPVTLILEGIVSNTPLNNEQQTRKVKSAEGFTFETTAAASVIAGQPGVAEAAFTKLQQLREKGVPITIITRFKTYTNMVMSSLVVPRNASTGECVRFTATFKNVVIVKNKTTTAAISKEPKAKAKIAKGKKVPETTAEPTKKKSMLFTLDESTGGGVTKLLTKVIGSPSTAAAVP